MTTNAEQDARIEALEAKVAALIEQVATLAASEAIATDNPERAARDAHIDTVLEKYYANDKPV